MYYTQINTALGQIILAEQQSAIVGVWFIPQRHFNGIQSDWLPQETVLLKQAGQQLLSYLQGELQQFDLPLSPQGTAFQQRVWQALQAIPYGQTVSYGYVAELIGQPKAARAVGAAIGKNPIGMMIPCHRVIGSQRQLTGYAGGLERKQCLLALEKKAC